MTTFNYSEHKYQYQKNGFVLVYYTDTHKAEFQGVDGFGEYIEHEVAENVKSLQHAKFIWGV